MMACVCCILDVVRLTGNGSYGKLKVDRTFIDLFRSHLFQLHSAWQKGSLGPLSRIMVCCTKLCMLLPK